MSGRKYFVRAHWDADAGVYVSESDIKGLHLEAETLDAFEDLVFEVAADLVLANHIAPVDKTCDPKDWVPTIIWQRPAEAASA